jgi:hypothetical protein
MEINQILPDVFDEDVETREALILQINKKHTGGIVHFLKSFIVEKNIFVKFFENKISDYRYGKYNTKLKKFTDDFVKIDISFLKMVKSLSNDENLILIGFLEVYINNFSISSI